MFWPNASLSHSRTKAFYHFLSFFMPRKKGLNNFYMSTRIISDTNTATKRGNLAWISRNVGQKAFVGINNENEKNNAELVAIQTKTNKTTKCHKCQQKVLQKKEATWKLILHTCIGVKWHKCNYIYATWHYPWPYSAEIQLAKMVRYHDKSLLNRYYITYSVSLGIFFWCYKLDKW